LTRTPPTHQDGEFVQLIVAEASRELEMEMELKLRLDNLIILWHLGFTKDSPGCGDNDAFWESGKMWDREEGREDYGLEDYERRTTLALCIASKNCC